MTDDPVKQAWQASVEIGRVLPLEEVRKGARKFYRYIKWRNAVEYVAGVIVVASFTTYVVTLPHMLQKLGSALVVLAAFYALWQLHRRASAVPPEAAGTMPIMQFARTQLVRQRDAVRSILSWYILPFVPGLVMVLVGSLLVKTAAGKALGLIDAIGLAVMLAVFVGVWWVNQLAARKLQRHIDEIDALMGVVE